MRALAGALAAALVLLLPGASAAEAAKPKRRAEIVCFKKTVRTEGGRSVRRTVCRPRRAARVPVRRAPAVPVAPLPVVETPSVAAAPAPQPDAALSGPGAAPTAPAAPAPSSPLCEDDSVWLTAVAADLGTHFSLTLSRPCMRAGKVVVVLENRDAQEHDLRAVGLAPVRASRELVPATDPETSAQRTTALEEGSWRLYCSLPGHGSMTRDLTVTRAS